MAAIRDDGWHEVLPLIDHGCGSESGNGFFWVIDDQATQLVFEYNITHDHLDTLDPNVHRSLSSLSEEILIAELSREWRQGFQEVES
jgi:hypothetical protein